MAVKEMIIDLLEDPHVRIENPDCITAKNDIDIFRINNIFPKIDSFGNPRVMHIGHSICSQ